MTLAAEEWQGLAIAALWLALILLLAAGAFKMVKRVRERGLPVVGSFNGREADDALDAHLMLTKFRELHARGGLSDEEYRTIKTKLAPELRAGATGVVFEEAPGAGPGEEAADEESLNSDDGEG